LRLHSKHLLGLVAVLVAGTAFANDRDPVSQPLYDIVAVGRGSGKVVLATLSAPAEKLLWRFREIPVGPAGDVPLDFVVSSGGTKALAVTSDGTPRVLDLTKRITELNADDSFPPQHRLTKQLFPYALKGNVCLLDDLGQYDESNCMSAVAAVVHDDGRVLYALADGRLVIREAGHGDQEELPYRLPQGAQFQLVVGHRGDARDFLVLVTKPFAGQTAASSDHVTEVVDPRLPTTSLGQFTSVTVAGLCAQLAFSDSCPTARQTVRTGLLSEQMLATLGANLAEQTRPADIEWSFYRVAVNPELYAPVLEFALGEPDYPSDVDIWQEIRPLAKGTSRLANQAAYASMGDRRWSRCTSYVETLSYPGTWLIEYWFYYPFDEGKAHPHFHDSEHFFVEVDKLGGTVRNIFASDHDSFVPNNIYSTLVKGAAPVSLPLFATVELGKHAMAPDLNRDGRFTRGVDDNVHTEAYAFWGLRDRTSKVHFLMEPYLAYMTLPRYRDARFALANVETLFPDLDVPSEHQVCTLRPFPDDPPCVHCGDATAEAAVAHLVDHPDARAPESIYKPYVLPWREVRLGVGIYDWSEGRGQLSLAYVGDFRHMTGGLLPIPLRVGVEYGWKPFGKAVVAPLGGRNKYVFSNSTMYSGARFERPVTNTQGFYFAVTPKWVDISKKVVNGVISPSDLHWQYGGVSYHLGYVVELPSEHKGNFTNHIGVVIRDAPSYPVLFEWRVSFGFLRQRGRRNFGAALGDRNPYE
jgi:hypothetical protein